MLVGGLTMSSIFNSKKILRLIVIYLSIGIMAIGLSKVGFKENYFVFSIPFGVDRVTVGTKLNGEIVEETYTAK